jgi:hypothetical protein
MVQPINIHDDNDNANAQGKNVKMYLPFSVENRMRNVIGWQDSPHRKHARRAELQRNRLFLQGRMADAAP